MAGTERFHNKAFLGRQNERRLDRSRSGIRAARPILMPIWTISDVTPEGRYPRLNY
jgi:hypothetical protein